MPINKYLGANFIFKLYLETSKYIVTKISTYNFRLVDTACMHNIYCTISQTIGGYTGGLQILYIELYTPPCERRKTTNFPLSQTTQQTISDMNNTTAVTMQNTLNSLNDNYWVTGITVIIIDVHQNKDHHYRSITIATSTHCKKKHVDD